MTYGWALLVIVIVIAILLVMNPFSQPQSCRFDQIGFTCEGPVISASTGILYVKIMNGNNNAIKLYDVQCTPSKSASAPASTLTTTVVATIQRQDTFQVNATTSLNGVNGVKCATAGSLKAGTDFSGKVWIYYKNAEDGNDYPMRSASATLTTKAV